MEIQYEIVKGFIHLLLFSAQAVQADKLADIKQSSVLRVAVPQDFPPFGSVGTDLQPQGYDIDMAKYLAKELNVKLVTHEMNFARDVGDRVVFMNQGRVWETGQSDEVFSNPQTEELQSFLAAVR